MFKQKHLPGTHPRDFPGLWFVDPDAIETIRLAHPRAAHGVQEVRRAEPERIIRHVPRTPVREVGARLHEEAEVRDALEIHANCSCSFID